MPIVRFTGGPLDGHAAELPELPDDAYPGQLTLEVPAGLTIPQARGMRQIRLIAETEPLPSLPGKIVRYQYVGGFTFEYVMHE